MFERFTARSRRVLALSNAQARRLNSPTIDTIHVLLGLLEEGHGVGMKALRHLGVDVAGASSAAWQLAGSHAGERTAQGLLPQTPAAKQIIARAIEIARELGHHYVGTEHLTLALAQDPDGPGPKVLGALNVTADILRAEVLNVLAATPSRRGVLGRE